MGHGGDPLWEALCLGFLEAVLVGAGPRGQRPSGQQWPCSEPAACSRKVPRAVGAAFPPPDRWSRLVWMPHRRAAFPTYLGLSRNSGLRFTFPHLG